ncbi:HAD-IIA family hydrolase [Actinomadura macra]|uniref:HAD-IIA family hydrolase n=1 Tax=Actinomadura macra TaxID=46164 RepID=UPI0008316BA8|nr:HAD-IIA family hydrolase [Actinomadura macra]
MKGSDRPLCEAYDVALLDLDGVVYIGRRPVRAAPESLAKARAAGQRLAFVTNNASRTPAAVAELLSDVGVPASPDDVVTSAQAAARLLAERLPAGAKVLVVGGMGLRQALYAQGLRPVSRASEEPAAVVQGFSPGIAYDQLSEGARAVSAGALFVGSNGDLTIPGGDGPPNPGNGSLLRVISSSTGVDPIITGKPERPLHQESIRRTGARRPLVVGDRLDTDIEGAHNGGADSLLVFTGVTDPLQALTAPPRQRPTYVASDLTGLLVPHPEPVRDGEGHHCGGWTARGDGGRFTLSGSGDPYDGLRALASAAWADGGRPTAEALSGALDALAPLR